MKKILFVVISVITCTQFANSQNTAGIKAGLNIASLQQKFSPHEVKTNSLKSLTGYQFGAFYTVKLAKKWSMSGELNFSLVGARFPYFTYEDLMDTSGPSSYLSDRIGYLEVPFIVQYHIHKFYAGAGPAVAFHLFTSGLDSGSYLDNHKAVDISANVLAGYKITKRFDVNLRYSYGLTNIVQDPDLYGSYMTKVSLKNRYFNLSLLYALK